MEYSSGNCKKDNKAGCLKAKQINAKFGVELMAIAGNNDYYVQGKLFAGAKVSGKISPTGIEFVAFAGVAIEGKCAVGPVRFSGSLTAGIGASLKANIYDGVVTFEAGLSIGLGAAFTLEVDVKQIGRGTSQQYMRYKYRNESYLKCIVEESLFTHLQNK